MPMPDASSITPIQPPNLNSLSSMVNLGNQALDMQYKQGTMQSRIDEQAANTKKAQIGVSSDQFKFNKEQLQRVQDDAAALANDPVVAQAAQDPDNPQLYSQAMTQRLNEHAAFARGAGVPADIVDKTLAPYAEIAKNNPDRMLQFIKERQIAGVGGANQINAGQPNVAQVDNGQTIQGTNTNPYATGLPQGGPVFNVQKQIPVTQPITTPTGAKTIFGPQGAGAPQTELDPTTQNVLSGTGINFSNYEAGLNARAQSSNQILIRTAEMGNLINDFKPGAGTTVYTDIAKKLQAVGAPQALVDKVAGGDLSATQAFNKFIAQTVISTIRQSAGDDPAHASETEQYLKNNPTVDTDPRALKLFMDFTSKQASRDIIEQNMLANARKNGTLNPSTWISDINERMRGMGYQPHPTPPVGTATTPKPDASNTPAPSARTIVKQGTYGGKPVVQYSDGSVEYK